MYLPPNITYPSDMQDDYDILNYYISDLAPVGRYCTVVQCPSLDVIKLNLTLYLIKRHA